MEAIWLRTVKRSFRQFIARVSMRHAQLLFVLLALGATGALAAHTDAHRIAQHHSSVQGAQHRGDVRKTDMWIVAPAPARTDIHNAKELAAALQSHAGQVDYVRTVHGDHWVFQAAESADNTMIATVLNSEQRAGRILWFHRDGEATRKAH